MRRPPRPNWGPIGIWTLAAWLTISCIAITEGLFGPGAAYVLVCMALAVMVGNRVERRPMFGRIDDEWKCPHCTLLVRTNSPTWLAQFRNTHMCEGLHQARLRGE